MIYKLVLVVDHELTPHAAHWVFDSNPKPHPQPATALLRVCKAITEEARPVLYGENKWRLTTTSWRGKELFARYSMLFRHITIVLDGRDLSENDKHDIALDVHEDPHSDLGTKNIFAAGARMIHEMYIDEVEKLWKEKIDYLMDMGNLKSFVIDVKNVLCPSRCCRRKMIKNSLYKVLFEQLPHNGGRTLFNAPWLWPNGLPKMQIVGLMSTGERKMICDTYGFPGEVNEA